MRSDFTKLIPLPDIIFYLFQKKWLNNYNEQVRQLVGGELKKQKRMDGFYWMMEKTKYIPENGQNSLANCQSLITPIIMIIIINLTM